MSQNQKTDIQYAADQLIKRLDELAINDLLRLKLMLYISKSFESEEVLDENCKILSLCKEK